MKKCLYLILPILLFASCRVRNDVNPPEENTYTDITLAYGCAYADAHEDTVGEQLFAFAIGDVEIDSKGDVSDYSNGYYLQVVLYADELTHDKLFKPGVFPVSNTSRKWTTRRGYDVDLEHPGYAYGGTVLYKVEDGFFTDATLMTAGTVTVEGSTDNAKFTIDLKDKKGNKYQYKSTGLVDMLDSVPQFDANYKGFEKDSVQHVTINADYAELKYYDSYNMFTLSLVNSRGGYRANLSAYYQPSGDKIIGTFPVGSGPFDTTPGTALYSRGCKKTKLYNCFAGVLSSDGVNYDYVNYSLLFVTGGSMTIDAEDNVNATFTTFYGSTIDVTFSGIIVRK